MFVVYWAEARNRSQPPPGRGQARDLAWRPETEHKVATNLRQLAWTALAPPPGSANRRGRDTAGDSDGAGEHQAASWAENSESAAGPGSSLTRKRSTNLRHWQTIVSLAGCVTRPARAVTCPSLAAAARVGGS